MKKDTAREETGRLEKLRACMRQTLRQADAKNACAQTRDPFRRLTDRRSAAAARTAYHASTAGRENNPGRAGGRRRPNTQKPAAVSCNGLLGSDASPPEAPAATPDSAVPQTPALPTSETCCPRPHTASEHCEGTIPKNA